MSLVVRLTSQDSSSEDRFDDQLERDAIARYCVSKNCTYMFSDKYAPIDMFATKPDGTRVALELTCNAVWTSQLEYPAETIHIPQRKWKIFHEQTQDIARKNVTRAERAYLVVLNTVHTRALFIKFKDILDLTSFTTDTRSIYGKPDVFVNIPISYNVGYVDIPPEGV